MKTQARIFPKSNKTQAMPLNVRVYVSLGFNRIHDAFIEPHHSNASIEMATARSMWPRIDQKHVYTLALSAPCQYHQEILPFRDIHLESVFRLSTLRKLRLGCQLMEI